MEPRNNSRLLHCALKKMYEFYHLLNFNTVITFDKIRISYEDQHMKDKRIVNARKTNKMRFILGITICSLVVVMTFTALSLSLTDFFKTGSTEAGIGTLKMFTTISNSIAAFAAAMCLPFQIDGLRRDRYRLPSWIVIVMYAGTVGVFLTFIMSMTIVSA